MNHRAEPVEDAGWLRRKVEHHGVMTLSHVRRDRPFGRLQLYFFMKQKTIRI
jgi:hypothetical protein